MQSDSRKWYANYTVRILSQNVDRRGSLNVAKSAMLTRDETLAIRFNDRSAAMWRTTLLLLLISVLMGLAGCGSGGYAGSGITSLSSSAVTIDAGQSFQVTASVSGNELVSWTLAGSNCSGSTCGSFANATGLTTTYTAPSGITSPLQVIAMAALPGTNSSQTVNITVNPDPTISGVLPAGSIGVPYSATLTAAHGTAPLTWSIAGALPDGLTFNAKTGTISGTPTTAGSTSFSAQVTDSSSVPYTTKAPETIAISTPVPHLAMVSGNTPAGTVGIAYSAQLNATGGTAPYSFSVTAGSLPAGLTLQSSTGAITGTPTTAGQANFAAQVLDASGATASGNFAILINPAGGGGSQPTGLTLSPLPGATVGTPYSATIAVSGGIAPYMCQQTTGSLPAGLTLSAGCVVSGTPSTAGTSTMTVTATDSSSPALTGTGIESITVAAATGSLTITSPPPATAGQPYTGTIGVSGGTGPYSCSITAGSLPAGLTLGANCVITGTPTTPGSSNVTVTATDSGNPTKTGTGQATVTVTAPAGSLTISSPPTATVGQPYTGTIGVSGGTAPYDCSITAGTLPSGLTLNTGCVITGTPTTAGSSTVTVTATDSSSPTESGTGQATVTVTAPASLTLSSPPTATVGMPYTGSIGVSGGAGPYSCSITAGTLPPGLTMGANCVITGTPTTIGSSTVTVNATDSSNPVETGTGQVTVTVAPAALTLTITNLPDATVGVPYSATISVSGGTAPYSCSITSGALPAGLSLGAACLVSGTPTVAGTVTLGVQATDSGNPMQTATGPVSLTVIAPASLTLSSPPAATVGQPYTGVIGVTGGTSPYSCSITAGSLPPGLTMGANCVITGTPTTVGSSTVTVDATDSSSPVETGTGQVTVTVSPAGLALSITNLPDATVGAPYSATIGVSGGTAPYSCTITSGTLPAGLTLGAACLVSGTPTVAGTVTLGVQATDSGNPMQTVTGPVSLTVIAPASLTLSSPPAATVGQPYTGVIGVTGGTSPYSCSITAGSLPPGLMMGANCVITGTPTMVGSSTVTVSATDSSNPVEAGTGQVTVTVSPAGLALSIMNLPDATVGTPYSATIGVSGGTAPYSCTITSGTLPAGLSLGAACLVSGTPTVAGTVTLGVQATDSGNPMQTATGPVSLTVLAPTTLTLASPPNAIVGQPYTGIIGVSGGKGPYTCTQTGGTLPAGLTLAANCTVSGTPTTAGTANITVKANDSSSPANSTTGPVTLTVVPAAVTLTLSPPPTATVGVPYTGTIGVSGGTAPYNCIKVSGTLPAGLTLGANCTVTGTPTAAGTSIVSITATDSKTPAPATVTGPVTITVDPVPPLTLAGSLPNATVNVPYSQTLTATGGIQPYTYTLTAGSLPPGLSLSSTGTIGGTPTQVGASSFTVTVTDSESTPQTASLPLVLLVTYPTTTTDSELMGPYAFLFQGYDDVLLGVLAYQTDTIGSFTADGVGGISDGELDTNHQSSNPTGNTVATQSFLGTYTLGTDNRGFMTITALNADGTTGVTSTYAITAKAPAAPATVSTSVDMIEFDNDNLQGTRGSGTMLAQQPASFVAGLNGSFAYGLSGDTPCLPSCTIGILSGPAAAVGQFATDGSGSLTSGTSDANIATTNYANELLTGSYGKADGNGRLDLNMQTAGTPTGVYPTDYAVYMVSANQAFLMSTDKHSAYVLLAGTAQMQTQTTFSNASLNGPMIGYENAQASPGLLGVVLGDTLNLSTATVFRTVNNGAGTCDFTNVDVAGLTGLVNGVSGLGGLATVQNALLGTYQSTGNSACTVAANGRGTLAYPNPGGVLSLVLGLLGLSTNPPAPRELYLISPNSGYFLETGYAGLGRFEAQTGNPYTTASLDGTYVYASIPASSLASINTSGILVADGAGHATTTTDLNVGVGTINLLQLGVTTTYPYQLTDATAGRFVLGTTIVLYEIAPGRFVLVDTNPLTTSPSVSLLY